MHHAGRLQHCARLGLHFVHGRCLLHGLQEYMTPLHLAAELLSVDVASVLLDKGASVDTLDMVCENPCHGVLCSACLQLRRHAGCLRFRFLSLFCTGVSCKRATTLQSVHFRREHLGLPIDAVGLNACAVQHGKSALHYAAESAVEHKGNTKLIVRS